MADGRVTWWDVTHLRRKLEPDGCSNSTRQLWHTSSDRPARGIGNCPSVSHLRRQRHLHRCAVSATARTRGVWARRHRCHHARSSRSGDSCFWCGRSYSHARPCAVATRTRASSSNSQATGIPRANAILLALSGSMSSRRSRSHPPLG